MWRLRDGENTNFELNILKIMKNIFSKVIICCKTKHEPLYDMIESKLKDNVAHYEDGNTSLNLSQSYFKTPKFIRINCSHIFLRGISSKHDLGIY